MKIRRLMRNPHPIPLNRVNGNKENILDNVESFSSLSGQMAAGAEEASVPVASDMEKSKISVPATVASDALVHREETIVHEVTEEVEAGGGQPPKGPVDHVKNFFFDMKRNIQAIPNWFAVPAMIIVCVAVFAIGSHVKNSYEEAMLAMREGPARAYALEDQGQKENASRTWAQVNAYGHWLGWPYAGGEDAPYLQRTVLAYHAGNWQQVTEFGFKALEKPITDRQAVAVQQMLLDATARLVRAYLPEREDVMKGGVPEHAAPVCNAKSNVWIVPLVLLIMAGVCLYGRMRIAFTICCLLVPVFLAGISRYDAGVNARCEARLLFDVDHVRLTADAVSYVRKNTANFILKEQKTFAPASF